MGFGIFLLPGGLWEGSLLKYTPVYLNGYRAVLRNSAITATLSTALPILRRQILCQRLKEALVALRAGAGNLLKPLEALKTETAAGIRVVWGGKFVGM